MGKKNSRVIYMHFNERSDILWQRWWRNVFVDLVNPMYEKWNKEFDELYPGTDGYDSKYLKFICEKHREPLRIANAKDMWLNEVELRSDITECGDVYGYVKNLEVAIYLSLN